LPIIFNGTSAHLGYTVPFTLVRAGKYKTENKLILQTIHKQKTQPRKKQTTQKTAKQKTTLVQLPFMTLGQETRRLILQPFQAHAGSVVSKLCLIQQVIV